METYDKLFRYAEIKNVSARSARRTVVSRLYERGADEAQVGLLLGLSERSAVRALLRRGVPRGKPQGVSEVEVPRRCMSLRALAFPVRTCGIQSMESGDGGKAQPGCAAQVLA